MTCEREMKVAIKRCKECCDNFCASCFSYVHRKGRLRRHGFESLVAMCHDCGDRAQVQPSQTGARYSHDVLVPLVRCSTGLNARGTKLLVKLVLA